MRRIIILFWLLIGVECEAQFAPQAFQPGSTAIYKDSSVFKDWAHVCTVVQGWKDAANISLGTAMNGTSQDATGYPDGSIVSLGDMGEAVYFFENPIVDSPGYDFAVFENGFLNQMDSNYAYLELAYVEVSNDGVNYVRFPSTCNNDTTVQIAGSGEYMDARKMNNLAGKYVADFGTPFDLYELAFSSSLQLDHIRYVRVRDVVGSIQKNICGRDHNNQIINDPYPTPFNTGGFDLDALGIIHQKFPTTTQDFTLHKEMILYPNPAREILNVHTTKSSYDYQIFDGLGRKRLEGELMNQVIPIVQLPAGSYLLRLRNKEGEHIQQMFLKW